MKQSSYIGQNWGRSQSTLSSGPLPLRKRRAGSWFEAQGLYAPGSERIPPRAWAWAALFIALGFGALYVGSIDGLFAARSAL
jgi:hypothetical protein